MEIVTIVRGVKLMRVVNMVTGVKMVTLVKTTWVKLFLPQYSVESLHDQFSSFSPSHLYRWKCLAVNTFRRMPIVGEILSSTFVILICSGVNSLNLSLLLTKILPCDALTNPMNSEEEENTIYNSVLSISPPLKLFQLPLIGLSQK